jgi:hypothetical protein
MVKAAARQFNKVMVDCPHCGSRKPKELVEGPFRFNTGLYFCISLFTCGLGLVLFPFLFQRNLEAYCSRCDDSFPYE